MIINSEGILNKNLSWLSFFVVFILVYYNNETFPSILFKGQGQTIIYIFLIIGIVFFYRIVLKKQLVYKSNTIIILTLCVLILLTMLFNQNFSGGYIKIIICLLIGYMIIHIVNVEEFATYYVKVMLFLAIYSLIVTYLIRPWIFSLPSFIAPVFTNEAGFSFINMRFSVVFNNPIYYRNFGIYREPGVYQFFLNMALIFELFFKKNKISPLTVMILCITVLSTFSTAGYITSLSIIVAYNFVSKNHYDSENNSNKKIYFLSVLFLILSITFIFFKSYEFSYMFTDTVDKFTNKESSYQGRMVAILANLKLWGDSPILGSGIQALANSVKDVMQTQFSYSTVHNTSTTGAMLVAFGLIFVIIVTTSLYMFIRESSQNTFVVLVIFLVIMFSINTQLLIYNEFLYTLIIFGGKNVKFENYLRGH
ncbi:O-antigen ligase family protein [Bacillus massilinigeriensis]|uniref:O-antigen ligase family protein n=1 Tax=Bacillus massilionigeriensis TaxID=1805475 RepID=UPI00096B2595|nr:O-antigen ligase family protein [Bacillus massilionigeriensis]